MTHPSVTPPAVFPSALAVERSNKRGDRLRVDLREIDDQDVVRARVQQDVDALARGVRDPQPLPRPHLEQVEPLLDRPLQALVGQHPHASCAAGAQQPGRQRQRQHDHDEPACPQAPPPPAD